MEAMTSELEAVAAAAKVLRRSEAATKRARAQLHDAILKANAAGCKQVYIVEASTYKREQVRRIVDAAKRKPKSDPDS